MTERTIARRYVRALFELALEAGEADQVLADLEKLADRLAAEKELAAMIADPRVPAAARKQAVERALPDGARPLVHDFAALLVDRGRQAVLNEARELFAQMLHEQRAEAVAEVVSAAPLDPESRAALSRELGAITGKKITLEEKVDASLLGGMRVKIGSTLLDASLRRRLFALRDDLKRVALPKLEPAPLDA